MRHSSSKGEPPQSETCRGGLSQSMTNRKAAQATNPPREPCCDTANSWHVRRPQSLPRSASRHFESQITYTLLRIAFADAHHVSKAVIPYWSKGRRHEGRKFNFYSSIHGGHRTLFVREPPSASASRPERNPSANANAWLTARMRRPFSHHNAALLLASTAQHCCLLAFQPNCQNG